MQTPPNHSHDKNPTKKKSEPLISRRTSHRPLTILSRTVERESKARADQTGKENGHVHFHSEVVRRLHVLI
jgi:hypothetical protein